MGVISELKTRCLSHIATYLQNMKNILTLSRTSSALLLALFLFLIPVLSGCQKERTADVSDILATVPSSAGSVVGVNLNSILVKAGCKIEGSKIIPGKELEKILSSSGASEKLSTTKANEVIKKIMKGESGIDPNGLIIFTDAYDTYVTGVLADTGTFSNFIEQETGSKFEDAADNVKICDNFAVSGAQFWMIAADSIDAKAIKNYKRLEPSQSFSSLPISAEIANMTNDIVGYGQIKSLMRSGLLPAFFDPTYFNLISGLLFDNASSLSFYVNFLKGKAEAKALILNKEGKPAKYLLPSDKINLEVFKLMPEKADAVAAISLPKSLIKKIEKVSESLGGNMLGNYKPVLSSLDGTSAVVLSDIENPEKNMTAVISTDGKPSLELMNILSFLGNTQKDGKYVKLSNGVVSGSIEVSKAAESLKNATMGVVFNPNSESFKGAAIGFNMVSFSLNPESGSITINLGAVTTDPGENALLTIIKKAAE